MTFSRIAHVFAVLILTAAAPAWGQAIVVDAEGGFIEGPDVMPLAPIPPNAQNFPISQTTPLPADAQKLVTEFDKEAAAIRAKAQKEIAARQQKLIEELTKIQDTLSKPGTLDQAVAVRDRIRQLKAGVQEGAVNAKPDPGNLFNLRKQVGQVFHFRVVGTSAGVIWGTGIYTADSRLSTAAVHAGVLREGQQGIVKVTILPGQPNYIGSQKNRVSSQDYAAFEGSYLVEAP